jgi:hypothetical protein
MLYENIQAWYRDAEAKGKNAGFIDGEKKGFIEGKKKGRADMLINLLEDDFGSVDQGTRFLVYELDEASLRQCFKRLKFAKSVHEVVGHLS